ncbi:TolC family protein [Flavobacterium procerum]|uniref:TolC family protein n=1 Tax=Flavobacterium procerum TaxID=1455569 RepID=A0ABV6BUW8_9FLAO
MKIPHMALLICCITILSSNAQQRITFSALDEIYAYAELNSNSFRNASQKLILAKYRTLESKLEMFKLKSTSSLSLIDNTKLSTNFMPAEIFGGVEGTFKPVVFGQKYVSSFTVESQIDIINPYVAARIKVSKANEELAAVDNLLDKKMIYESISAAYYNIRSCKQQIGVTRKSLSNADTLVFFMLNKQKEGLVRSQDVNLATTNQLTVKDKLQQLQIQEQQQYNVLKILCDIDLETDVMIKEEEKISSFIEFNERASGDLLQRQGEWNTKYQKALLRADKRWMYPTLSLFSSFSWQESNNSNFFGTKSWLGANYIGLKISIPILPESSKIMAVKFDRINLEMAQNNWKHSRLQNQINNEQLELDCKKAYESYQLNVKIETLQKDSYLKNFNIYKEGIISASDLINSFEDWLKSSLNSVALLAAAEYAKSRIIISNRIK